MLNKKSEFFTLTPNDNIDLRVYEEALDYVFKEGNIRNISISGPYGAGKSSVLASYEKIHKEKSFLHISLSHYQSEGDANHTKEILETNKIKNEKDIKELNNIIEGKIINQLIHQIDEKDIPCTNFKVKKDSNLKKGMILTFQYILEVLLLAHVLFFSQWKKFVGTLEGEFINGIINWTIEPNFRFYISIMLLANTSIIIYNLIKLISERSLLKKATIKGLEIEVFDNSDDSCFDKYLNEVLYLFKKVKADVVVFEDIDRYNSSLVFEHLREINTLVNARRIGKPLRFFYLTRDDIFENKDRTKFFDFIIPVVPVVDGSNAYDKFIDCFKLCGILDNKAYKIDEEFLQGLSLYINDMRLLQNICNELIIYQKSILTTEQCPNKMLALITYKNLFPKDFSDLQLSRGFLFEILGGNGKSRLISLEIERLKELEKNTKIILDNVNKEYITIDELAIICAIRICISRGQSNFNYYINPDNSRDYIQTIRRNSSHNAELQEYDERIKYCSKESKDRENRILELKLELSKGASQLQRLNDLNLKDHITRENIDELFKAEHISETGLIESFKTIKDSPYFPAMKYLVREGYIDETYPDYLTYFYGNSVSSKDKIFLRSVTDKKAKEQTYELDNAKLVVSHLPAIYFEQIETLNLDVFSFLIHDYNNARECDDKIKRYMKQIKNGKHYNFIINYYNKNNKNNNNNNNDDSLINLLGKEWKSFISEMFTEGKVGEESSTPASKCDIFLSQFALNFLFAIGKDSSKIAYLDEASLNKLRLYISSDYSIFKNNFFPDDFVNGLSLLDVKFKKINLDENSQQLLDIIYENNFYEININNIINSLGGFYFKYDDERSYSRNYSLIMRRSDSPLAKYINSKDNIDKYMEIIIDVCKEKINDDKACVISILNNENINDENKYRYISYLELDADKIDISYINNKELWPSLLKNKNVVEYTSKNILDYFFEHCKTLFDENLVNYINNYSQAVTFNLEVDFLDEDMKESFFDSTIYCNSLKNEIYKDMINQFDYYFPAFDITSISLEKLSILDDIDKLKMSKENLAFVREKKSEYLLKFIKNHIDGYVKLYSDVVIDENEINNIIQSDISDLEIVKVLNIYKLPISIQDKNISAQVEHHILCNNYLTEDFEYILKNYGKFAEITQNVVLKIAEENISETLERAIKLDRKLISDLLKSSKLSLENKKTVFKNSCNDASIEELKEWLPLINGRKFLEIFNKSKQPKFNNNSWDKFILDLFKQRRYISKYTLDKNDLHFSISRK